MSKTGKRNNRERRATTLNMNETNNAKQLIKLLVEIDKSTF